MHGAIKTGLKWGWRIVAILLIIALIFAVFNWTLLKNLPSSQDGGMDAMYIANQTPLQRIEGAVSSQINIDIMPVKRFIDAEEYWTQTGGKALLIWHKGALIYESYADGVTPEDRSRSFSMHKSILGLVAATMEADGLINLDDPVSQYVDAFKSKGREGLTIRNMLEHQGGLERYGFTPPSLDTMNLLLSHKVEKTALKAKMVADPSIFDYSNVNYQVAGAAIRAALREATEQSYAEYLSSRIWAPAGASDGYLWSETETGAPRFYAGLQASARDWLKVGIMIAQNSGEIVPQSAVQTLITPSAGNPNYGLGLWLGFPEDGSREYGPSTQMVVGGAQPLIIDDIVFFDGFGGQRVYVSQREQLVIVRIGDVRFDWDDTALPNHVAGSLGFRETYENNLILTGENDRTIPVRILAPISNCERCKLVIFSHGAFATDADYEALIEPLLDVGYQVAIPTHADSSANPNKDTINPQDYISLRVEDHNLILEHFAQSGVDDWVAVGHSFGAMMAAYYGGASKDSDGLNLASLGAPSHVIALSPPGEIPAYFPASNFSKLTVPTLLVTGTADLVPGMITDWEDHLQLQQGAAKGLVQAVIFEGRDHYFNGLYGRVSERATDEIDGALVSVMQDFLTGKPISSARGYTVAH